MADKADCTKEARHMLYEVYGTATTVQVGIFCDDHFESEKTRLYGMGQRVAFEVLSETRPCGIGNARNTYMSGSELTHDILRSWTGDAPRFRLPLKDETGDLRDVDGSMAQNAAARSLLNQMFIRCMDVTRRAPTVMMLRNVLEELAIPVEQAQA